MTALRLYRDPGPLTCAYEGCEKPRGGGRYCSMHAGRMWRWGTYERNEKVISVKLTNMCPMGRNITALRLRKDISVARLAKASGVSVWALHNVCRGESCLLDTIRSIAAALDVEAWQLLKPDEFPLPTDFEARCR